jgi:FkbM family methyltransferase
VRIADRVVKPGYLLRPDQLLRRIVNQRRRDAEITTVLPWGARIRVSTTAPLGIGIARRGVHELAVTEVLWRLADREDAALDVGANIGYFTLLLAARCREVRAFEPHPMLHRALARNVEMLGAAARKVTIYECAVSDRTGTAMLSIPAEFSVDPTGASLVASDDAVAVEEVPTVRLDDVLGTSRVGVLKLDVEGHEAAALAGAERALMAGAIRDVVFEEHHALPTAASELLTSNGYSIFGLRERLTGVELIEPSATGARPRWDAPSYLATREPERAAQRLGRRGWHSLRPRGV